jgi:hypothetical protein
MPWRSPDKLQKAIQDHKAHFGDEPSLISIKTSYLHAHANYFQGRIHTLCCGKGALFDGIPLVITESPFCHDFLIAY